MSRLFFAVPIKPTPALRQAARQLEWLGKSIRCVPRDQWHVTLKFLGETSDELIPQLIEIGRRAAASQRMTAVRLAGLGVFPHLARPQVAWCGLTEAGSLTELAEALDAGCEPLGIERERRGFHPHVTLGRIKMKPPPEFRELIEAHAATDFGVAELSRMILYRSELSPQGSRYVVVETWSLSG